MEYIIIGGDERFAHLARLLAARGMRVGVLGREAVSGVATVGEDALARAENVVVNCPPKLKGEGISREEILAGTPARVYLCGPGHPPLSEDNVIDLWADEALQLDNARLTAEGALSAAMRSGSRAIGDTRAMVVGYGRIGRALTELLVALGADCLVASRSEAGRNRAVERGATAADTARIGAALPGRQLIFNTAPATVLDAEALKRADPGAMIVDLASPPYGVDLRAAWSRGLRAWREPGLPGRYCPESAARALLAAMERSGAHV